MQTTLYGIANGESTIAAIEACKSKWTNETSFCVFTISQQTRLNTTFLMIALDKLVEAGLVVCQVVNGEKRYSLPTSETMERNEMVVRLSRLLNDVACQRNKLCRGSMNDTKWIRFDLLDDFCEEQSAFLDDFSGMNSFERMFL